VPCSSQFCVHYLCKFERCFFEMFKSLPLCLGVAPFNHQSSINDLLFRPKAEIFWNEHVLRYNPVHFETQFWEMLQWYFILFLVVIMLWQCYTWLRYLLTWTEELPNTSNSTNIYTYLLYLNKINKLKKGNKLNSSTFPFLTNAHNYCKILDVTVNPEIKTDCGDATVNWQCV